VVCPGRTINEILACVAADQAAAGLPAVKPRGRSGLLYEVQAARAGLPTDPELARRMAAGPLHYRGQTLIPAIFEALTVATSPLAGGLAVAQAALTTGKLGDQPGLTGVVRLLGAPAPAAPGGAAAVNGDVFGGDFFGGDSFYSDVGAVQDYSWGEAPGFGSVSIPGEFGYASEAGLGGIMAGVGTDAYTSPLPTGYLMPGEVSGMPGGVTPGSWDLESILGGAGRLVSTVGSIARLIGGANPLGGARAIAPGVLGAVGLGGLTSALGPGVAATTGGTMLGSLVPAIATAAGRITATRAWGLVRRNGLTAVATALGIGAAELAQWLMANPPRRRRRRGISSRDVRTTKRVVGFVCRINDQLRAIKSRKVC